MSDDLQRFLDAQEPVLDQVLMELRAGRKRTHWMWFVFPQLAGLGYSAMARFYAIADLNEARRYLEHPVLGDRLELCTSTVNANEGKSAHAIFGPPDDLKFRSCMTLFDAAASGRTAFGEALDRFFAGSPDAETLRRLEPSRT
jgi:uncharacterized protein (DUF1810 family)